MEAMGETVSAGGLLSELLTKFVRSLSGIPKAHLVAYYAFILLLDGLE